MASQLRQAWTATAERGVAAPSRMSPVRAFLDLLRAVRGSVTVALSRTSRRTRLVAALVGLVVAVIGVVAIAALTGTDDDAGVASPRGADAEVVPGTGGEDVAGDSPAATPTPVPGDASTTTGATTDTGDPAAPPGTGAGDAPAAGPAGAAPSAGTTAATASTPTTGEAGAPAAGSTTTTRPRTTTTTAPEEDEPGLIGSLLDALLGG